MRIFYAAGASPNPDVVSHGWRTNLYGSLAAMGHEVVEFDYDMSETLQHLDAARPEDAAFIATNRPRLTGALLDQLEREHRRVPFRLFFSYFYDACVEAGAIDRIRALGITTVNWYCNASYQLHLVSRIAPHYDYCLVPEKNRLADYRALGARPIYCQEAANADVYTPRQVPQDLDVTFVGGCYGERPGLVRWLRAGGVDVRVFGPRWEYHVAPRSRNPLRRWRRSSKGLPASAVGGVLSDTALVETYSRSKINLGFSTCGDTHANAAPVTQIRLRDFEVPMSGGFYLTGHLPDLEEFFEVGREIETYRSREELLDKIRFYLAHDAARDRVRRAGRERCLRDHTWRRRFETAFLEMGLS
jgi:spore maturation protein CgeB